MNNTMNKILSILDKTETSKKLMFLYNLILPISYFFEYIAYKYFWNKIILEELLTNDNIVNFLDENEFGFKPNKIYKMDIIEEDNALASLNVEEAQIAVKKEFTNTIVKIIKDNVTIDIENYINLNIDVTIIPENKLKQYTVTIRYYRYYLIVKNFKLLIWWLISLACISGGLFFLYNFYRNIMS